MNEQLSQIDGLQRIPVVVNERWNTKTVTTDPPRYVPHEEYTLSFDFKCEVPVLPVLVLVDGKDAAFSKPWRSASDESLGIHMSFFPYDWKESDEVRISVGGLNAAVFDADFKRDPRPFVSTLASVPSHTVTTGSIIALATVTVDRPIELRLLLITKTDTVSKRGRWAMKPELLRDIPPQFQFLGAGQCSGTFVDAGASPVGAETLAKWEKRAPGWVIRCKKCGYTQPFGKYGIRRGAASGKKCTIGRCPRCKRICCHFIEKRP